MIPVGFGNQNITVSGRTFRLYTYRPKVEIGEALGGLLVVYHGNSRNAVDYCRYAQQIADEMKLVVVAPLFSAIAFNNDQYNRASAYPNQVDNLHFDKGIIDWARGQFEPSHTYIFGFSAGAQRVSRLASYRPIPNVDRYILGAPSTFVWPSVTEDAPYGFDYAPGLDEEALNRTLALPISVICGEQDNDPNDPDLSNNSAASRQGTHRLSRAIGYINSGVAISIQRNVDFNWSLFTVPEVGHSSGQVLRSSQMGEALRGPQKPVEMPSPSEPSPPTPTSPWPSIDGYERLEGEFIIYRKI